MRRPSGSSVSAAAVLPGPAQVARWTLALLIATLLLVSPPGAGGAAHAETDDLVLAGVEEEEAIPEEDLGPEPQPREDPDNAARSLAGYEDRELMFTWGASFLLLGLVVTALVVGGTLWYLLVIRANRETSAS